jgi:hypothetical protein
MNKTKKKYKEETIKQSTARKNRNIAALLKETYKGGPSVHPLDMKIHRSSRRSSSLLRHKEDQL